METKLNKRENKILEQIADDPVNLPAIARRIYRLELKIRRLKNGK